MRLFVGYRPVPPAEYADKGLANPPDRPQYQGVVFDDGTVALRWMTSYKSTSLFKNYREFFKVHGHPEYGTRIEWVQAQPGALIMVGPNDGLVTDPPDFMDMLTPDAF